MSSILLTCCNLLCDHTGANDQQTTLQEKQKLLQESKQLLAEKQAVVEPETV